MATLTRIAAALMLALLAGVAHPEISVRDDTGYEVKLAAPARRIVSLAPHATELVFAAGGQDRIVGAVRGSTYPAAARDVPIVGDVNALDLERIVALKPDLVVTWPYTTPAQVAKLKDRGLPVFTTDPASIDGIATNIERLGTLAGRPAVAAEAAERFRAEIAQATMRTTNRRVRVFYQIWSAPLFTIGGSHLITQAIRACGGENIFAALTIPAPQVSLEAVIAARPDTIIAGTDQAQRPAWLDDWNRWPDLPAVRERLLQVVDADRLHRPGPRFASGVRELCDAIERARAPKGVVPAKAGTQ
jgi:iron complex transport system substrate-binding protein